MTESGGHHSLGATIDVPKALHIAAQQASSWHRAGTPGKNFWLPPCPSQTPTLQPQCTCSRPHTRQPQNPQGTGHKCWAIRDRRLAMSGNAGREAGSAAQHSQMRADRGAGVPWGISGLSPRSMTARAAWMPFRPAKGIYLTHEGISQRSGTSCCVCCTDTSGHLPYRCQPQLLAAVGTRRAVSLHAALWLIDHQPWGVKEAGCQGEARPAARTCAGLRCKGGALQTLRS